MHFKCLKIFEVKQRSERNVEGTRRGIETLEGNMELGLVNKVRQDLLLPIHFISAGFSLLKST